MYIIFHEYKVINKTILSHLFQNYTSESRSYGKLYGGKEMGGQSVFAYNKKTACFYIYENFELVLKFDLRYNKFLYYLIDFSLPTWKPVQRWCWWSGPFVSSVTLGPVDTFATRCINFRIIMDCLRTVTISVTLWCPWYAR